MKERPLGSVSALDGEMVTLRSPVSGDRIYLKVSNNCQVCSQASMAEHTKVCILVKYGDTLERRQWPQVVTK